MVSRGISAKTGTFEQVLSNNHLVNVQGQFEQKMLSTNQIFSDKYAV